MKYFQSHSETFQGFMNKIKTYGTMIKFSHSVFALPFALSAVILAGREYEITAAKIFWILIAMVSARSSAMGFNRIADAALDGKNPRTKMREIPSGKLSMNSAAAFVVLSGAVFITASAFLSSLCLYLSFPVLAALYLYSFTKRFTYWCHIYLGVAIGLSPLGAWIAVTGSLSFPIILLSLALLTHIGGFDILYACQDISFDKKEALHSLPAALGPEKAMKISTYLHIGTWLLFLSLYFAFDLNLFYIATVCCTGILLIIEHKLVNPDDLSNINIAFFHINSIISILLIIGITGGIL